jgi:hypothetical protein
LLDLHTIADDFSELSNHLEVSNRYFQHALRSLSKGDVVYLNDKHADADAWIAADDAERVKLREAAEKKHAAVRAELARIRVVSRDDYLSRKRRDMNDWRDRNKPADKARQKAWRENNREYCRQRMKDFRSRVKADPVAYAEEQKSNTRRMRERRALWKSDPVKYASEIDNERRIRREAARRKKAMWKADPEKYADAIRAFREAENLRMRKKNARIRDDPRYAQKKEEKKLKNREYQRSHPVQMTPEQKQAKRDYNNARYREMKKRAA